MKRGRTAPEEQQNIPNGGAAAPTGATAPVGAGKYGGPGTGEDIPAHGEPGGKRPRGFGRHGRPGGPRRFGPPGGMGGPGGFGPPGSMGRTSGMEAMLKEQAGIPEELSEGMRIIIPDFIKIRKTFFVLDCTFVLICFLLEVCYLIASHYSSDTLMVSISDTAYLVRQVAIPTGLNVLILLALTICSKKLPQSNEDMRQNFLPLIAMMLICMVISITHCDMTITLGVYVVPIVMTTVYTNERICKLATMVGFDGQMIAIIKHLIMTKSPSQRLIIGIESLVIVLVLVICMKVVLALLGMTAAQRYKMYSFTADIKEAQLQADAANRAKSAFLANMSHEIRTPINAILGMDEMILRESRDDQITEYAETIYSASTSLLYLVNDVLDISKIESGKLEIVENTFDTSSLVHDCCNMINERVTKKGLAFKVFCNPNLPSQLLGDEVHLRQIITNLLSNAAKYTEKGSVTLSVDQQTTDGQFQLMISVKDTGIGISEEDLGKLFSQFTRLDLNKTRTIEGTGLGLSITKQLVDLMGGQITAESTYGEGSTFKVVLPQKVVDDTPMGNIDQRYSESMKKNTSYHKGFEAPSAAILVVDDVEGNLKVVSNLLKQTKVRVDTAISGKICLEKVAQYQYDIIFMDHMMPEMNGIETYLKMQEMDNSMNRDTPVIMLTANAITGVKDEYMKAGFTDYMSKPVLADKLEKMIVQYLPEDKIVYREASAEETEAAKPAVSEEESDKAPKINLIRLQEFFQAYPKIDIVHGLEHFGQNTNIYISSLHVLCKKLDTEAVKAAFEEQDAEKYEMLMHDIKRFAMKDGFFKLSELAGLLEEAAQKQDWEYIVSANDPFITECNNIIDGIRKNLDRRV